MKAPCKNCEWRIADPNCHDSCKEYRQFVEICELKKEKIKEEKNKFNMYMEVDYHGCKK